MEVSVIYDLLAPEKLDEYREELKKADDTFTKKEKEKKEELEKSLNEEQQKLLKDYLFDLAILEEYIDYQVELRALNWGIKIGIQLQHSIKDLYKYFDDPNDYE